MDLNMSYSELRVLAKELGLKANMKADKLIRAITLHYEKEKKQKSPQAKEGEDGVLEDAHLNQDGKEKDASSTSVFVNTRQRRRNCGKRRTSQNTAEAEEQTDAGSTSSRGKKRKTSSEVELEPSASEPEQADTKDQATVPRETKSPPKVSKTGRIPRYQGPQQKTKTPLKQLTPNFKKLHEAQFNKMESIDRYVQRKTRQVEASKIPDSKKMKPSRPTMFSPVPVKAKVPEEKCRNTVLSKVPLNKAAAIKERASFRPSVLSTRTINVRFSEATLDNEFKRSLVKTPARKSPCITSSTPQRRAAEAGKPNSSLLAQKTPGPLIFTGNTSISATPGTQKKPTFDLKASLSRPLNYKPHKGKLKPFEDVSKNATGRKSLGTSTHQESYKQCKIQTREDRRKTQTESRKQKKEKMLGARRGLVMM